MVDLCSGIGSWSMACVPGVRLVAAYDRSSVAKTVHDANHAVACTLIDLNELDPDTVPDCDLIVSSPPCQGWSSAGRRAGVGDRRWRVLDRILAVVRRKAPAYYVLENVAALRRAEAEFDRIRGELRGAGYAVSWCVLNTLHHGGLPQYRRRLFLVGSRVGGPVDLGFEAVPCPPITRYLDRRAPAKYYYGPRHASWSARRRLVTESVFRTGAVYIDGRRRKRRYVCPCLTHGMGVSGRKPTIRDDAGIRMLTPREFMRLQGHADMRTGGVCDKQLYALLGNAITRPVCARMLSRIVRHHHRNADPSARCAA